MPHLAMIFIHLFKHLKFETIYFNALTISMKSLATNEGPPTRPPSTSGQANNSLALPAFTLPPYRIGISSASEPYLFLTTERTKACISCAWFVDAVLPVPIAQIGS